MWYFCAKKSMEKCYLLISEKFLFWSFRKWEIRPFFEPKIWWKDNIYWLLKVLVLNISMMGNTAFFESRRWWKDGIYLVFFSFTWYSRTWEIWFFVQWQVWSYLPLAKNWPETPCIKPKPLWNKTQWCFEMWLRFCVKS